MRLNTATGGTTPFEYPEPPAEESDPRKEAIHQVTQFISERILAKLDRTSTRRATAMTIAVRLVVLNELLSPSGRSLRYYARALGCTPAYLSQVGLEFSASIGMRASWQRINARKSYADRARGVHDGTWVATSENGKWERRKLREARQRRDAAPQTEPAMAAQQANS